ADGDRALLARADGGRRVGGPPVRRQADQRPAGSWACDVHRLLGGAAVPRTNRARLQWELFDEPGGAAPAGAVAVFRHRRADAAGGLKWVTSSRNAPAPLACPRGNASPDRSAPARRRHRWCDWHTVPSQATVATPCFRAARGSAEGRR